jgi:outer membrane protein assembly factor BamB
MAGHDPARSSHAPDDSYEHFGSDKENRNAKPQWVRPFTDYIPTKAHLITRKAADGLPDLLLVPTAGGLHALDPANGEDRWVYKTEMPVGHSPTVSGTMMVVPCYDKRLHGVDLGTGKALWKTAEAGAGFDTNPVVIDGKVYTGCRDGYFYCFDAEDGSLVWSFQAGGPITYSAAYADGVLYFAAMDSHAYAIQAKDGSLVWKSEKLPGRGFFAFWPVVSGEKVFFSGSNNYSPSIKGGTLVNLNKAQAWPKEKIKKYEYIGPKDADGWVDASRFVEYLNEYPNRKSLFVLDRATGKEVETAPILWWGNCDDNRYPPVVGPNGTLYVNTPWYWSGDFLKGRLAAWEPGTTKIQVREGIESNDEPEAYALLGENTFARCDGGDGMDKGGIAQWGTENYIGWDMKVFHAANPEYYDNWERFKYGTKLNPQKRIGTHGHQNPPVPLNGRVYFHRSSSVVCY